MELDQFLKNTERHKSQPKMKCPSTVGEAEIRNIFLPLLTIPKHLRILISSLATKQFQNAASNNLPSSAAVKNDGAIPPFPRTSARRNYLLRATMHFKRTFLN
jgi:hypothetical protein